MHLIKAAWHTISSQNWISQMRLLGWVQFDTLSDPSVHFAPAVLSSPRHYQIFDSFLISYSNACSMRNMSNETRYEHLMKWNLINNKKRPASIFWNLIFFVASTMHLMKSTEVGEPLKTNLKNFLFKNMTLNLTNVFECKSFAWTLIIRLGTQNYPTIMEKKTSD